MKFVWTYRQTSDISRPNPNTKCFSFVLQLYLPNLENENAMGAAPTGVGPTKYEESTILLLTKAALMFSGTLNRVQYSSELE